MLLVHDADHLVARDLERVTGGDSSGRGQTKARNRSQRPFSDKIAFGEERDGGLLADSGNNGDLCPAFLQVEDRVRGVSLGKKVLPGLQLHNSSPQAGIGQESMDVKCGFCKFDHRKAFSGYGLDRPP